jgi:hypothetical protein
MWGSLKPRFLLVAVAVVSPGPSAPLDPSEWRYYTPILSSQTRPLEDGEADKLLARVCQTPVHIVRGVGQSCTTRHLGPEFSDLVDYSYHPKSVIFGHFLGPESDDAAVSGWSAETHPYRWGGTLLLTKRGAGWSPVWYRSAIIIDSCEKVALPDRREMLLCEDEDSGMGAEIHDLYVVDFEHPEDPRDSPLATAVTYKDSCFNQKQRLIGFHWKSDGQGFSLEVETAEWKRLSDEPYCNYLKRPPPSIPLSFTVTSNGLRRIASPLKR